MCKISVIVPVFYTGKYLKKCIESVLNNDFSDFEILIIDDGSSEEDKKLCDSFLLKDVRIKVFHNENHGLAYSRNFGVEKASGEYMFFLDSDDYISKNTFSSLAKIANETNADIIMAGLIFESEDGNQKFARFKKGPLGKAELSKQLPVLKEKNLIDTSVDKLYKRSFLKNTGVLMPVGEIFEDTAFNLTLLKFEPEIFCTDECFYHYIQHIGSMTKKFNKDKLLTLRKRYFLLKEISPENNNYWDYYYLKCAFSSFIDLYLLKDKKKSKEYIRNEISADIFKSCAENAKGLSFYQKTVIFVAKTKNLFLISLFSKLLFILKYKLSGIFLKMR